MDFCRISRVAILCPPIAIGVHLRNKAYGWRKCSPGHEDGKIYAGPARAAFFSPWALLGTDLDQKLC